MNINRNLIFIFFLIISLLSILSTSAFAQTENEEINIQNQEERMKLIKASQQLRQEHNEEEAAAISLYTTTYHSGNKELNLGAKYENRLLKNMTKSVININYVIEAIYLEGEDTNLAGFLSFKASLKDKLFTPYIGAGAEIMGKADYQAFVGLNLTDNFFVETKFINDQDDTGSGDFYSAVGFKINF